MQEVVVEGRGEGNLSSLPQPQPPLARVRGSCSEISKGNSMSSLTATTKKWRIELMRGILIVAHALSTILIGGILSVADAAADTGISPQRQTQLIHLLRQDCGSCHGMTLKGGLGSPLLPDNLTGKPDELLVDTILNGRPDTAMPPWRGELSHTEAAWLVEQLREGLTDAAR